MNHAAAAPRLTAAYVAARIAAALLGGWAFVWGFVSLLVTGLVALGWDYHEAHLLAMLLAFLVYLAALCWSFAAARLGLVWLVLLGGALLMSGAAWWLQRALLG